MTRGVAMQGPGQADKDAKKARSRGYMTCTRKMGTPASSGTQILRASDRVSAN
jgi:hypothetical protein